ncbi:phosphoheptose isomerase [Actinobacillus equuli]|nr:phosphoheptose isomerase [Actinobacillus equuli]
MHKYDLARPSFAAQLLQFDGVLAGVIAQDNDLAQIYRKQLQAIAKEGDLFISFSPLGDEEAVLNALHSAKMKV